MATATHVLTPEESEAHPPREAVVVRFAGDSGDGMQLTGGQFTLSTALAGNDLATFPDFPAEIRAPQGTMFGVSAFQINFGSTRHRHRRRRAGRAGGDEPGGAEDQRRRAARRRADHRRRGRVHHAQPRQGGVRRPTRSRTAASPNGSCSHFDISQLTLDAVKPFGLGNKEALRCKNMWTLGLALWMFDRDRAADRRLAQGQVRQGAGARRRQYRRAQRRPCLWRDGRDRRPGPQAPPRRRRRPSPASTARSPAPKRSASASSPARSWPG